MGVAGDRATNGRRNPWRGTAAFIVLVTLTLGVAACESAQSWEGADEELAALAREVADNAQRNDFNYFRGLTADTDRVPDLIQEVARSGIATNYAEHLEVESDTEAALVYGREGDSTFATPFSVELSLHDGMPRVDQIILGEDRGEITARLGDLVEPTAQSETAVPPNVSVSIAPAPLAAGSEHSALVSYANTSDGREWVSLPLNAHAIVVDTEGARLWIWGPFAAPDPTDTVMLAPLESAYAVVRFTAPEPGTYLLYGRVDDTLSPSVSFETAEE